MFTGIVTAVGTVAQATRETLKDSRTVAGNPQGLPDGRGKREAGLGLTIRAPCRGLKRGESIAVNGACLTVEKVVPGGFRVHVVETTEDRTLFAEYARGRRVNLERALRAADRLGGHLVQGHVDGTGEFVSLEHLGDENWWLKIRVPAELDRYLVFKGSIAIDGIQR